MKEFLKGNYKVDVEIKETEAEAEAGATEAFERKALSRLGGSICFVSKKSFMWQGEAQPAGGAAAEATTKTSSRADTEDGPAKAR
ncbi:MAG TPA: hypothetical protein VFO18_05490 [Methylomirabilota bacterium]|nr:hypothetical protein [Methylomirabilota bacterium]